MKERYGKEETRKVAEKLLGLISPRNDRATIVGLSGELGAGKTTLVQEIAAVLGVQETLQSPTFVIAKFYRTAGGGFRELVHVDAYRLDDVAELAPLGWVEILARPETLVVVEWPSRISDALPADTHHFSIHHDDDARTIVGAQ